MFRFRNLPLRRKLTLIILFTSAVVLLLVIGATMAFEMLRFRHSLVRELSTEAEILADNSSAALAFGDAAGADDILKSLHAQPAIVQASLFTSDGKLFAEYQSDEVTKDFPNVIMQAPGHRDEPGYVLMFRPVKFGGEIIGTIMLRSDLREQTATLRFNACLAVLALLVTLLIALVLSLKMQRIISEPVLELADVAHRVTVGKDYSLRVGKTGDDEIGLLMKEFNQMLEQIEKHHVELRASEKRFRQLAESIREVFWLSDAAKSQVFYISPGFEMIWGRSCEELISAPLIWLESIHSEDRERIRHVISGNEPAQIYDEEYRIVRPDGTLRWIHDRAFPVYDETGNICRFAGIAEDITRRKEGEEALQAAESKYRNIFENAIEGIFQTTPEGRYLSANSALARMLGFVSPDELMASVKDLGEQLCVDSGSRLALMKQVEMRGEVREFENQLRCKDGSLIWVSLNVRGVRDGQGKMLFYEGSCYDITQRKRIEAALRQSERQYRQLVELAQEGIWSVDVEGRTTYANPHLAEMLGYTMPEMVGKHLFEFMDAAGMEICQSNLERRKKGIAEQHEFELIRKDGTRILTNMATAPVTDPSGKYGGAIACVSDITERHRADETLRRTEQLYRRVITGAGAVPYVCDSKTGSFLFIGDGVELLIGYTPQEMISGIWTQIAQESAMVGESAGLTVEEAGRRFESGTIKVWRCERRVTTRQEQTRWISDIAVPNYDSAGNLIGSMGILQDITERKQTEKKSAAFSSLASQLSAVTTPEAAGRNILETAQQLIGWDSAFIRLYDHKRDCVVPILTFDLVNGKPTEMSVWDETDPSLMTRWIIKNGAKLIGEGDRAAMSFPFVPFGNTSRVSTSMIYVPIRQDDLVIGVLSIQHYDPNPYSNVDLDLLQALADHCGGALQRIKVTKELLEAEAKYRAIFENATEGFFQATPEGQYLRGNPALAQMFGYSTFEQMFASISDIAQQSFVLPERHREFKRLLELHGEIKGFEAERYRQDGSKFWISIDARAVRDDIGALLYYEGMTRDVTARRHLEKQLIEIADREQSRMGQDLHDGLCQQLVRAAFAVNLLEKDLVAQSGSPLDEAKKVSRLVDDAITQARNLARGLYPVKLESEGFHSAMQELAATISATYQLDCDFESDDVNSINDHAIAMHLYRIAQEGASNAAKHAQPKHIQIRLHRVGGKIHLTIADDGNGIAAPDARKKGMGLHIMNYRAGMIGATLKIEPKLTGGTLLSCMFENQKGWEKSKLNL